MTRLVYLLQSIDTTQTIDVDVVSAQSAENPVYYVQYAHARIHSLGRHGRGPRRGAGTAGWVGSVGARARARAGCAEGAGVAARHRGGCDVRSPGPAPSDDVGPRAGGRPSTGSGTTAPILRDDVGEDVRQARLWLVEATRVGLAVALGILGCVGPGEAVARWPDRRTSSASEAVAAAPPPAARQPRACHRVGSVSGDATCSSWPTTHGTPLFVYDEEHLRSRCREAVAAFGAGRGLCRQGVPVRGHGSPRALRGDGPRRGHRRRAARSAGCGRARGPPRAARQQQVDGRAARGRREAGVGRIVVDSFDELDRLDALHAETGARPKVLLRFTPGVEAHTHAYLVTGGR